MVTVLLPQSCAARRDEIRARLAEQGIDTRPFFHPLSSLPAYRARSAADLLAVPCNGSSNPRARAAPLW